MPIGYICTALLAVALMTIQPSSAAPVPNASDVGSINGIVMAAYASISGTKGHARDWKRFRSLFAPDARMMAVIRRKSALPRLGVFSVERYIELDDPIMVQKGFFEVETGRQVMQFRGIASVFSSYAAHLDGGPIFDRGVNNFQLFFDGSRWYIVSIYWDSADETHPVPSLPRVKR